eukprot:364283-Chlamydomonas_euryale.AAC.10
MQHAASARAAEPKPHRDGSRSASFAQPTLGGRYRQAPCDQPLLRKVTHLRGHSEIDNRFDGARTSSATQAATRPRGATQALLLRGRRRRRQRPRPACRVHAVAAAAAFGRCNRQLVVEAGPFAVCHGTDCRTAGGPGGGGR